jgi:DNA-binding transcriptional MerR regulator
MDHRWNDGIAVTTSDRDLSPAETARRLGVSVKALRVYEARGLLTPRRTEAGWRVYGQAEMARLHQILVLKDLGLSLTQIATVLTGTMARLDAVLALQETTLRHRRYRMDQALALVARARARLSAGDALSPDDLTQLTKETLMSEPLTQAEHREAFEPLWRKHLNPKEIATLHDRSKDLAFDQAEITRAWEDIFAEARRLMEAGDKTSPRARALLARWIDLAQQFTGGDAEIHRKMSNVWRDALTNPELAPRLPVGADLWAFVQDIARENPNTKV